MNHHKIVKTLTFFTPLFGLFLELTPQVFNHPTEISATFLLARLLYYVIFETCWYATPAKTLTDTRVVTAKSEKPVTFSTILVRTLARFVPFEVFSIFSAAGLWHDRWTDTRVVKTMPTSETEKTANPQTENPSSIRSF